MNTFAIDTKILNSRENTKKFSCVNFTQKIWIIEYVVLYLRKIYAVMNKFTNSVSGKIALTGVMALILLIPLEMVKSQIRDRQEALDTSQREVAASWGLPQTLTGPVLQFTYEELGKNASDKIIMEKKTSNLYPRTLHFEIETTTQELHRSIYDIMVYGADVVATGEFVIPESYNKREYTSESVWMGFSDLRGIEGTVDFVLGQETYTLRDGTEAKSDHKKQPRIIGPVELQTAVMDGKTVLPFKLTYRVRGSSSLMVKPYGEITEVRIHSNCPNPSFIGDFLPSEREVSEDGFSARWSVSKINRGSPDDTSFGVNLLKGVTQYQQTTRSAKYGILIILLVFIAGLSLEFLGKKRISLVQYLIIGLSLVLFYALVLSFSEFMPFAVAYGLSSLMTVGALYAYFRGILRGPAWLPATLVAVAYLFCYILIQMETFALLSGTLVLFALLLGVMYLTRNLNLENQTDN